MSVTETVARTQQPPSQAALQRPGLFGSSIYPPGATNANWFDLLNGVSWQITLGSPLILYAKSQGASSTLLGVLAALTPLLVILQLPAARYLPRYGYRRFMLAGWGSRSICIFGLAIVPLLVFIPPAAKLLLVWLLLFGFNVIRGLASAAWFPWITELIPEHLRGRFLSRDQIFSQTGCVISLTISALVLRGDPTHWQFALVFLVSAVAATLSLLFLRQVPDVTAPEQMKKSGLRVPWTAMLTYPPFFRLICFDLLCFAVSGALPVFTVAFLKGETDYSESRILWLSAISFASSLLVMSRLGRFLDHRGSKPVLLACQVIYAVVLLGYWGLAGRTVAQAVSIVAALQFLTGIARTSFDVANWRLMMQIIPLMGRNHFFALHAVITNLGFGLAPILWGIVLDAIGAREVINGAVAWNRYSIYFGLCLGIALVSAGCVSLLHEKRTQRPTMPA